MSKKRKQRKRQLFCCLFIVVFCMIVLVLGGVAWSWFRSALQPAGEESETQLVHVQREGLEALALQLEGEGLVQSATAFRLMGAWRMRRHDETPQAGHYDLAPNMPAEEIWHMICSGKVATRKVTFPEGFTVAQMGERLAQVLGIDAEAFVAAAHGSRVTRRFDFKLPDMLLEGYLFPTTYSFRVDSQPEDIVAEMVATMDKVFATPYADEIARSGRSLHDLLTMASLVEREARKADERAVIAGVLYNRLKIDMKLQCDATVQYALPEHKSRLLYRDLEVDSPYNTYRYKGLPPGGICNPGLPSLEAALRPAEHDYLFYVARPDGSHVFTRTYADHQAAIRRIRGR